jgi:acetyl-CoA carboxylase biotin carboxyl carrier protein
MTEHETPREEEPMSDAALVEEQARVEPVAVGPGEPGGAAAGHNGAGGDPHAAEALPDGAAPDAGALPAVGTMSESDASLLALIDRLAAVLEKGDLGELEVASGATTVILRAPSAIERPAALAAPLVTDHGAAVLAPGQADASPVEAALAPVAAKPSVKAPLTGIFYGAPSPGATAYVAVGDHVAVGQIIGLIEAMKLFNEIKSDLAGRVVRVCADNGALVKAKQPLIEVEPA